MEVLDKIKGYADRMTEIRRDIHAHPEIGFEEVRTSGLVARELESYGVEVHTGLGKTGVDGVIKGKRGTGKRVGLRAVVLDVTNRKLLVKRMIADPTPSLPGGAAWIA